VTLGTGLAKTISLLRLGSGSFANSACPPTSVALNYNAPVEYECSSRRQENTSTVVAVISYCTSYACYAR
jgi:hypothetical protein